MTENKRFMIDDAGTLIDMRTREMYDIVEEVCPVLNALYDENEELKQKVNFYKYFQKDARRLEKENEQLKKGMIEVVDRYIKNVECNPPSSLQTYGKIKGALINIREGLRDLIEDLE